MQHFEVSGAIRPIYGSLGVKRLTEMSVRKHLLGDKGGRFLRLT